MADPKTTMPSLVERLRSSEVAKALTDEAAQEIERLRTWLHYIDGNFRDGPECAYEALRGDVAPEGFAP